MPDDADPQLEHALSKIQAKSEEMARLVEDLLRQARDASQKLELEIRKTDMRELALGCIEAAPPDSNHEILFDAPAKLPLVPCDPTEMGYVISNLLSNAAKYSPDGGPIRVALSVPDGMFRLEVEDHGVGISSSDMNRIFDRFTQGDMSMTRQFGGVGLGLHMVKEIVEAHGGTVEVRSRVGKGSTSAVDLPRTRGV